MTRSHPRAVEASLLNLKVIRQLYEYPTLVRTHGLAFRRRHYSCCSNILLQLQEPIVRHYSSSSGIFVMVALCLSTFQSLSPGGLGLVMIAEGVLQLV